MSEMVAEELMKPIRRRVAAGSADAQPSAARDVGTQSQTTYARWRVTPRFILSTTDSVTVGDTRPR